MAKLFKSIHYRTAELTGFIALIGVILVQRIIRPAVSSENEQLSFFLGIMPNFLGGIGMTMVIFIQGFHFFSKRKISLHYANLISACASFAGLWIWEYVQATAGHAVDYLDIGVSAFGALLAYLVLFMGIRKNRQQNITEL